MTTTRHHPHDHTTAPAVSGTDRQIERLQEAATLTLEAHGIPSSPSDGSPHIGFDDGEVALKLFTRIHTMPRLEDGEVVFEEDEWLDMWADLEIYHRGRLVLELHIHNCGQTHPARFRRGPWENRVLAFGRGGERGHE